jgi:Uma2 family endonuclease
MNYLLREPISAYGKSFFTPQEYLDIERERADKHEFFKGKIFAMPYPDKIHNLIYSNLFSRLFTKLDGTSSKPYGAEMRIHILENSLFTYPDISVICGDIVNAYADEDTAILPSVLFEILSSGTSSYDQGDKFELYRDIPSLKEYIIVDSESVRIDAYRINDAGHWGLKQYKDKDDSLVLPGLNISIPLRDIYQRTKLS